MAVSTPGLLVMMFSAGVLLPSALLPSAPQPCTALDQTIEIQDEGLRKAIREELKTPANAPITCGALRELQKLSARDRSITSLAGLEHATKISRLDLGNNRVRDLTPLTGLEALTSLILDRNVIVDLTPLLKSGRIRSGVVSVDVRRNCLDLTDKSTDVTAIETLLGLRVALEYRPPKEPSACPSQDEVTGRSPTGPQAR